MISLKQGRRERFGLAGIERTLFLKNAVIVVITVVVLVSACLYSVAADLKASETFAPGVCIDGIEVHGLSYSDAVDSVTEKSKEYLSGISIPIVAENRHFTLQASDFISIELGDTVDRAFSIGKDNDGTDLTVDDEDNEFNTCFQIDVDKLRRLLEAMADQTNVDPVEPEAIFVKDTRSFTYVEGSNGIALNVDTCIDAIIDKIERQDYTEFRLIYDELKPMYTIQQLEENTKLISEFTSVTTDNFNRNTNIDLMCSYIDGFVLEPGGILSINDLVGERTIEKGFLAAPAIMDGKRTVDDIGGGICQVSGTMYNAALRANMRIVERLPHSWPSDYLEIGLDSTLDWNTQKDLKIQNVSDYNMYFAAWLESSNLFGKNVVHIAIYGQPFPDGVTVDVRSEIVETYAPEATRVTYTTTLSPGATVTVIAARTGYKTRAWRDFYFDGVLIDSEIVGESYYAPIRGEVRVGKSNGSTPSPVPTPTPDVTEEPDPTLEPPEPTLPPISNVGD